jgi:hypothetical protein
MAVDPIQPASNRALETRMLDNREVPRNRRYDAPRDDENDAMSTVVLLQRKTIIPLQVAALQMRGRLFY